MILVLMVAGLVYGEAGRSERAGAYDYGCQGHNFIAIIKADQSMFCKICTLITLCFANHASCPQCTLPVVNMPFAGQREWF